MKRNGIAIVVLPLNPVKSSPASPYPGIKTPPTKIDDDELAAQALGAMASSALELLARWIGQKLMDGTNKASLKKDLVTIDGEMSRYAKARKSALIDDFAKTGEAYVVAKIAIVFQADGNSGLVFHAGTQIEELFPSDKKYEGEADPKPSIGGSVGGNLAGRSVRRFYISAGVPFSKAECDRYRETLSTLNWLKERRRNAKSSTKVSGAEYHEILTGISTVEDWISGEVRDHRIQADPEPVGAEQPTTIAIPHERVDQAAARPDIRRKSSHAP